MTVLVTGGTGDVGRYLLLELLENGEEPVAFDIAPRTEGLADIKNRITLVKGNVLNLSEVFDVIRRHDVRKVIHLAGLLTADGAVRPFETLNVNVMGTATVLEACRLGGVKRFIYASTSSVYGPSPPDVVVTEEYQERPWNLYGVSKHAADLYSRIYSNKYGMEYSAIRLKILLAPGQRKDTGAMNILHDIFGKALKGEPVTLPYYPEDSIHITYVKDAAHAFTLASSAESLPHPAYNVVSGFYSLDEIASSLRKVVPGSSVSFERRIRLDTVIASSGPYDISLAEKELGYKPMYGIQDMIREIVEYEKSSTRSKI